MTRKKGSKQSRGALGTIYAREGGKCHYCQDPVFLAPSGDSPMSSHPKRATRDHIVPRYYGGESHPRNYVLACAECNSGRNHDLWVCDCQRCTLVMTEFIETDIFVDNMFASMVKFSRCRVKKYAGRWNVYTMDCTFPFDTFDDAIEFAYSKDKSHGKTYNS